MSEGKEISVYVLRLNDKPIYVGQTNNINKRLSKHKALGKVFNSHVVVETFDNRRDALICERGIIKYLSIFQCKSIENGLYMNLDSKLNYIR